MTAERRVEELDRDLARELGKEALRRAEYSDALAALTRACAGAGAWKIRAAILGLRLAPHLTRYVYVGRADASAAS
jgi:hypothetical protein